MGKTNLFLLSIFVLGFTSTYACDCDEIVDTEKSNLVFRGKVLSVKKQESSAYAITFKVKKKVKGQIKKRRVTIYTPCLSDLCCGIPFQVGDVYFIVTKTIHDKFYATRCTTTSKLKSG